MHDGGEHTPRHFNRVGRTSRA